MQTSKTNKFFTLKINNGSRSSWVFNSLSKYSEHTSKTKNIKTIKQKAPVNVPSEMLLLRYAEKRPSGFHLKHNLVRVILLLIWFIRQKNWIDIILQSWQCITTNLYALCVFYETPARAKAIRPDKYDLLVVSDAFAIDHVPCWCI